MGYGDGVTMAATVLLMEVQYQAKLVFLGSVSAMKSVNELLLDRQCVARGLPVQSNSFALTFLF